MTTDDPKKRLLNATMALVQQGENPTTRELAQKAGVNIAAINYYFQGKDNLIAQALDQAAVQDLEAWIATEIPPHLDPHERLKNLALFLGRIHRNFHTIANLQLSVIVLPGRPELATKLACHTLANLIANIRGYPQPDYNAHVQATSLMASIHYLSIFHSQFESLANIPIQSDQDRDFYILSLLHHANLRPHRGTTP